MVQAPSVPHVRAAPVRRVLPPPKPPPTKISPVVMVLLVVVLLAAGGYYGYETFLNKPSTSHASAKPAAAAKPATPAPAAEPAAPSVSVTLNQAAAVPAQAINKAENAVAAHNAAETGPANEVISNEKPAAPASPAAASAPAQTTVDATDTAATAAPESSAPQTVHIDLGPESASPEFKAFISDLRVSGVFQGEHPRVLINGRTFEVGEMVNDDLGVVFTGIDAERELVLFKDRTGVTLVKKY